VSGVSALVATILAAMAALSASTMSPGGTGPGANDRTVELTADDADGFPDPDPAVDRLESGAVLRIHVTGFDEFAEAHVEQCITVARQWCDNRLPVQFGEDGSALFQYQVTDDFAVAADHGRCRAYEAPCLVVVTGADGEARTQVLTVFGDAAPPPGRIEVTPRTGLEDGQAVTVTVEGFPAGAQVWAKLCVPPATTGSEHCGEPGPTAPLTARADGTGRTTLMVRTGPVGTEGIPCRHDQPCGVSVASETVFARTAVVPISFTPPGANYDPARTSAGLAVAAALLASVTWLVRRTDWTPIGEAHAPEIDDADYADLDALVAAQPPQEKTELD
jgi:hypothetical protein